MSGNQFWAGDYQDECSFRKITQRGEAVGKRPFYPYPRRLGFKQRWYSVFLGFGCYNKNCINWGSLNHKSFE
jgi:hypothetical protein